MDVNRSGGLAHFRLRIGQRVLDEQRRAREAGDGIALVDMKLVLPLDRDDHPWLRRMEVEMARPKTQPGAGRDRGKAGERAIVKTERLDRAGVFRLVRFGV